MNLGLEGKTVFVTGASGGIGRATAEVLAAEGATEENVAVALGALAAQHRPSTAS